MLSRTVWNLKAAVKQAVEPSCPNSPRTISSQRRNPRQSQSSGEQSQPHASSENPHASCEDPRESCKQPLENIIQNRADLLSSADDEPHADILPAIR
ncbi:hypothetical protein HHI36_001902 [Cryptolaemus montrouzieri]|uniref:Uncharacterized protein n=1 Tax=Cryptolaemus montrouzieri TaxID=559131 RepID=A0ABD2P8Z1_9CUCU